MGVVRKFGGSVAMGMSGRAESALLKAHITTIAQLIELSESDLLKLRMVGQGTVNHIRLRLAMVGLSLRSD